MQLNWFWKHLVASDLSVWRALFSYAEWDYWNGKFYDKLEKNNKNKNAN